VSQLFWVCVSYIRQSKWYYSIQVNNYVDIPCLGNLLPGRQQSLKTSVSSTKLVADICHVSITDRKWILNMSADVRLMYSKGPHCMPFNFVEKPGFQTSLLQNKLIRDYSDLPCTDTLCCYKVSWPFTNESPMKAEDLLSKAPTNVAMITDYYLRRSYITFTMPFDFILQNFALRSVLSDEVCGWKNQGSNGPDSDKILITAQENRIRHRPGSRPGSNIVKGCKLAEVEWCAAWYMTFTISLHVTDTLCNCEMIRSLIKRVKDFWRHVCMWRASWNKSLEQMELEQLWRAASNDCEWAERRNRVDCRWNRRRCSHQVRRPIKIWYDYIKTALPCMDPME
jgi:hypothetical protein